MKNVLPKTLSDLRRLLLLQTASILCVAAALQLPSVPIQGLLLGIRVRCLDLLDVEEVCCLFLLVDLGVIFNSS